MSTSTKAAEMERAAIDAGWCFAKDHGRWFVLAPDGGRLLPVVEYASRGAVRAAMVRAYRASVSL